MGYMGSSGMNNFIWHMCVAENGTIKNFKPLDLGVPQFLPLN
jgi:hypothetical protein